MDDQDDEKYNQKKYQLDYIDEHILSKYEIINKIGRGAYGIVWKAIEKKNREVVALKKVFDAFANPTDAQRTYREICFLSEIGNHDNIVKLLNVKKARNNKDIYLVMDYLETDLHTVIRANICEDIQRQYITFQLLKGLLYIHSADIIHRDLKPSNVLINADCLVKLADFGLARFLYQTDHQVPLLSDYVATRWYRAPEILLGSPRYESHVDMWALGCIIAELYLNKPLFPGSSTLNQLSRIIEITGKPTVTDLQDIHSPLAMTMFESLNLNKEKRPLHLVIPNADPIALDLIQKLLVFRPTKRITAAEALKHEFVKRFHNEDDEPVCIKQVNIVLDDNRKFEVKKYRDELYKYIKKRNQQLRRERKMVTYYSKYRDYH